MVIIFAILHLRVQIKISTQFAGMVMIYHYNELHVLSSVVQYLLSTNQKLKKNFTLPSCSYFTLYKNTPT
jgi:hypothetical protein